MSGADAGAEDEKQFPWYRSYNNSKIEIKSQLGGPLLY